MGIASWQPSKYSRVQLEERRLAALEWLQASTATHKEIAEHFGVSVKTVSSWKERLKKNGTLQATVAQGRTPFLTQEQHDQVRTLLREGPLAHGFPDDTWTTPRVRELIGRNLNVWYHRDHVRKLLHALGFTPQKPDGRAVERNDQRIMTWVEQVHPELEKKGG
ncbi:winged helix-turn-helix domain-containing protein [Deinococcus peraridilitoris]|uniref:winged helix-turn-helix domain-containing protein n=1 Tax=Deinococcus peraridilitoris TaxID=432329 RepID=UPI000304E329|nr:winged helix-turn-helix domain-containing protein [Deinococcus peraridilitoris]